jgi:hypothetical protein
MACVRKCKGVCGQTHKSTRPRKSGNTQVGERALQGKTANAQRKKAQKARGPTRIRCRTGACEQSCLRTHPQIRKVGNEVKHLHANAQTRIGTTRELQKCLQLRKLCHHALGKAPTCKRRGAKLQLASAKESARMPASTNSHARRHEKLPLTAQNSEAFDRASTQGHKNTKREPQRHKRAQKANAGAEGRRAAGPKREQDACEGTNGFAGKCSKTTRVQMHKKRAGEAGSKQAPKKSWSEKASTRKHASTLGASAFDPQKHTARKAHKATSSQTAIWVLRCGAIPRPCACFRVRLGDRMFHALVPPRATLHATAHV